MVRAATASQVALGHLIDYAGMYPPESLSLAEALSTYQRHQRGAHRWMLGVLLCPSSQLHDLEWMLGGKPTPVGVVVDQPIVEALEAMAISGLRIRQVETRDLAIADHLALMARNQDLWLETDPKRVLDVAVESPGRMIGVKLRCGGPNPADFPSSENLSEVMHTTFACGLAFKATAGLHHPWRHFWPELGVWRHGFMNLAAAAAALVLNGDRDAATEMIEATDGRLGRSGLRVGSREFTASDLRSARIFFRSYGSCSFDEPVEDLLSIGSLW
ncbi:MAG: hypothetical protein ABR609_14385 [Acidimicrobiia bacterium]